MAFQGDAFQTDAFQAPISVTLSPTAGAATADTTSPTLPNVAINVTAGEATADASTPTVLAEVHRTVNAVAAEATADATQPARSVKIFIPPTVNDVPVLEVPPPHPLTNALFKFSSPQARSRTVLKENGTYVTVDYPLSSRLDAAEKVYLGGHIYEINPTEEAELVAAGYTVTSIDRSG